MHPEAEIAFNRPALLTELTRLAASAPSEPHGFLPHELRVAADSLDVIAKGGDRLGRLYRLRLLSEIAIRLRWIAGDEDVSDGDGRPAVDRATAQVRIAMILKRDTIRLAEAQAAIHRMRGSIAAETAELGRRIDAMDHGAAPGDPRDMASAPASRSAYTAYRMASALIHPGLGIGRADLVPDARIDEMADEVAYLIATYGDSLSRSLGSAPA